MKRLMFSNRDYKIINILIVLICVCFSTIAQNDTIRKNKYYLWTNLGGNTGISTNSTILVGLQLGLNFSINLKHYFKINSYASGSFEGFPFIAIVPNKLRYIKNVSLLYGIIRYNSKSFATIMSTGISYGEAQYRGDLLYTLHQGNCLVCIDKDVFDYDNYSYWGVPIDLTFLVTSPINGFSIDLFANIHKHTDYGIRLNYNIGKIRTRPTR